MDKLLEKYLSDIKSALPFYRLIGFLAAMLQSVASHEVIKLSLFRDMLAWRFEKFSLDKSGIGGTAICGDIFLGFVICFAGCLIYWTIQKSLIVLLENKLDIQKRKQDAVVRFSFKCEISDELKRDRLEWLKRRFEKNIVDAKRWNGFGELACIVGFSLMFFSFYSGIEDFIIGLVFFLLAILSMSVSLYRYLRYAIPYEIQLASLYSTPVDDKILLF